MNNIFKTLGIASDLWVCTLVFFLITTLVSKPTKDIVTVQAQQVVVDSLKKRIKELEKITSLNPDFISYEPPELIGSKDISVATAKPDVIAQAVEISKKSGIPLVVGAGVHSAQDVKKCLSLGAVGVAVASDVMKALDPKKELLDLTEGFR